MKCITTSDYFIIPSLGRQSKCTGRPGVGVDCGIVVGVGISKIMLSFYVQVLCDGQGAIRQAYCTSEGLVP